jgi:serine protease AprX
MGTPDTADDRVASYSSRGPSLMDHILKPDVLAPGNRIVSLAAAGSTLVTGNPVNRVDAAGNGTAAPDAPYFSLSGTSMASGVVSGIVALMLQADPNASPASVKARLMKTADKSIPGDLYSRGAGAVRAVPAVASREVAQWSVSPLVVQTAQGVAIQRNLSAQNALWSDHALRGDNALWSDHALWGDNALWGENAIQADQALWAETALWADSTALADSALWGDNALWADQLNALSQLAAENALWADTALWSDTALIAIGGED